MKYENLIRLIKASPGLGVAFLNYHCKILRLMCFQTGNLSFYDALTRVSNFLYVCARDRTVEDGCVRLKLTEQDLSNIMATSRVHVSRILKVMQEKGIIKKVRGQIIIRDLDRLFDMCRF